jgi:hypothetical protein
MEEDVLLQHRHLKPSVYLVSAHQDMWQPCVLHATLLWRSPTSFRNCTPVSLLLNRNVRNSLLATPNCPHTAHPYGMDRMKGVMSTTCCWYVALTLLIRSAIASLHLHSNTQIDCCKLMLQATGTDTVSGINLWMLQPFHSHRDTQVLNKGVRGVLHGERLKDRRKTHWLLLYPTGFSTSCGFMECKRRK